jgi:hypothetical protein
VDLAALTLAAFEPLVGERFTIDPGTAPAVELVLEAASAAGDRPGGRQPFSLTFRGPPDPLLPQATYRLEHDTFGAPEIFVVPIGRDASGVRYEAIFT